MELLYQDEQTFYTDFLPLIAELECGRHYDAGNPQHVHWLRQRLRVLFASGANAICLYDRGSPIGFLLLVFDPGLQGVRCFGKKATIAMFGLLAAHRGQGHGAQLLGEAEAFVRRGGGECIYVDTYPAGAEGAIALRYYIKHSFTPVAYHPGENGLSDQGQVYLWKPLPA